MTALETLKRYWGYDAFRPAQEEIIASVLAGHDTLGLLPTGGGKSITFQVPALMRPGLTFVVSPLISLMKDQVDNLRALDIPAYTLHSGLSMSEVRLALDKCRLGKAKILYLSPEKLTSETFQSQLRQLPIGTLVVDEAHCISQWGYDFRPSYLRIAELREDFPQAPLLALTASATPEVVEDIRRQLHFRPGHQTFQRSFTRANISYIVRHADYKEGELLHILQGVPGTAIVYTRSRKRTREIAQSLQTQGVSADYYHAGLDPEEKTERQNRWKSGATRVIVATTAFGMGIDKPDVRLVVHTDLATSLEEYYQEAGRAGRDGLTSYAVTLVARTDRGILRRRLSDAFPPKEFVRKVYGLLCVFLDVAMGEGYQKVAEFNLGLFCKRFSLPITQTASALRLLSQSGYIEYVEEVATRSRVIMTVERHKLYELELDDEADRVLQRLLRTTTGLFADYQVISEGLLAVDLHLTERTVYEALLRLSRQHVLHFIPHSNTPYIYFLCRRIPDGDILLPQAVYEFRQRQMERRLKAMEEFVYAEAGCRVNTLLRYFGEEPSEPCGTCDLCRARRKSQGSASPPKEASSTSHTSDSGSLSPSATLLYLAGQLRQGRLPSDIARRSGLTLRQIAALARPLVASGHIIILPSGALWAPPLKI